MPVYGFFELVLRTISKAQNLIRISWNSEKTDLYWYKQICPLKLLTFLINSDFRTNSQRTEMKAMGNVVIPKETEFTQIFTTRAWSFLQRDSNR